MAFELRRLWLRLFRGAAETQEEADDAGVEQLEILADTLEGVEGASGARCKRRGHPIYPGQKDADCFDCYLLDLRDAEWAAARPPAVGVELAGALLCLKGAHRGESFSLALLQDAPVIIGADPDCDIVLSDPSVSRRHLAVVRRASRTIVRDLGSLHHSALRAEGEVQWQVLDPDREYWFRDGAHLLVGDVEVLFRATDAEGQKVFAAGAADRARTLTAGSPS